MTRDDIIQLANSVGFVLAHNAADEAVDRFGDLIELAKAAEREACAKLCTAEWSAIEEREFGRELAALIRARSAA